MSNLQMTESLLAEFACLTPIYVDGVAGFARLAGDNLDALFPVADDQGPAKI